MDLVTNSTKLHHALCWCKIPLCSQIAWGRGSSVGRARDFWWGGPVFDSRSGRPLPTGWVGVSIMWPAETEVMVSQLCLMSGSTSNCQTLCLGARLRYNLVDDEDVKKPTKQTKQNKQNTNRLVADESKPKKYVVQLKCQRCFCERSLNLVSIPHS